MTKVQVHYNLVRPLNEEDAESVARAHAVYGIMRVYLAPTLDQVTVDFDASRLSQKDVKAALIRTGVPIRRDALVTPGL